MIIMNVPVFTANQSDEDFDDAEIAVTEKKAYYIPRNQHVTPPPQATLGLFDRTPSDAAADTYKRDPILDLLKPILEDPDIPKYTHNGKFEYQVCRLSRPGRRKLC